MEKMFAILTLLGCASCAAGDPPQAVSAPARAQASGTDSNTLSDIRKLVGTASCADSSQCHSLPVGARGCGGPEFYLAWSSVDNKGDQLRALAERYKTERTAENTATGRVSDCRFAVDPGATCQAGTCQLRSGPLVR